MDTQKIWDNFNNELYFFILKKTKNKDATNDIFQNTFLKIHNNMSQLKEEDKVRAWIFQIARNEIVNHFNKASVYVEAFHTNNDVFQEKYKHICCFDKFINDLPKIHRDVIELIYIQGLKQNNVSKILDISLENVKARVKRAKELLKKKLNTCCKYEFDKKGNLTGEPNCASCKN